MKYISPKTYAVIHKILELVDFSQTKLREQTKVSLGRINSIIKSLEESRTVVKSSGTYRLERPNFLIKEVSSQVKIRKKYEFSVNMPKKDFLKEMQQHNGVFCLFSSLELIKDYSDEQIHIYYNDEIISWIKSLPLGNTTINIYESNLGIFPFEIKKGSTDFIRTLIDLKSVGFTQDLSKPILEKWKTLQ
ncbi:MAG TPA: hypothetical protein ENN46_03505 [Candidatus Woesearchaeota archaeon]|nr:hypothetical protein [Candidatus Woesearchaeota archaeon]